MLIGLGAADHRMSLMISLKLASRSVKLVGIGFTVLLVLVIWFAFTFKAPKEQGQGKVDLTPGIEVIEPKLQEKVAEFLAAESWENVGHLVKGGDQIQNQLSLYQQRSPKESVNIKEYRPLDIIMVRGDQCGKRLLITHPNLLPNTLQQFLLTGFLFSLTLLQRLLSRD